MVNEYSGQFHALYSGNYKNGISQIDPEIKRFCSIDPPPPIFTHLNSIAFIFVKNGYL